MAVLECKICGGMNEMFPGVALMPCRFCGSQMTLPLMKDENHAAAFNRGNHFRRIGEFDRALAVYERIVQEDETNAEAHWCCALCRFGIEYVQDPASGAYLPTCHRASFDSFLDDVDYLAALEHADETARRQYQQDAEQIARVQRGILAVSQSEKPFDVFICYKETGADGQRTHDSQLAQDIYYQLTDQGLRVFFARITLEDKAGTQYEPYIFAALNSAKVMVVIGTKPEHLSATWVRNEWSRFLALMKRDRSRLLIPCYRDMDPYDMPEQLSVLQSYDMSRIGFIQDLVRGIRKVVGEEKPEPAPDTVVVQQNAAPATEPLLRRVALFLEDGDWQSADAYCEKVLDADPECARAYVGKLMAALHVTQQKKLPDAEIPFDSDPNYRKALRFADAALKKELQDANAHIRERNENARKEAAYRKAEQALAAAELEQDFIAAKKLFVAMNGWKDAAKQAQLCAEKAEEARKNDIYDEASLSMTNEPTETTLTEAIRMFQTIPGWRDADQRVETCRQMIAELKAKAAARAEAAKKAAQQRKRRIGIGTAVLAAVVAVVLLVTQVIIPNSKYNAAVALMESGDYEAAIAAFEALDGYKDSEAQINTAIMEGKYNAAVALEEDGETALAAIAFGKLAHYKDAHSRSLELWDNIAVRNSIAAGNYHTVGLRADGTVVAVGSNAYGKCDTSAWSDIVAIAAGDSHTVGLRADGTVVVVGSNGSGQCNTSAWSDIVAIAAGDEHTVGLRADGTVVAVGYNYYGQCKTSAWTDIVAIAAGDSHTVGLRADGTVVAVGSNGFGKCNTSAWSDIVAIAAGDYRTVGLRADGTVVAVGDNTSVDRNTSAWSDIIAIAEGDKHTVGLRADGTVVAVGDNDYGQCDVTDWRLKTVPRPTLPQYPPSGQALPRPVRFLYAPAQNLPNPRPQMHSPTAPIRAILSPTASVPQTKFIIHNSSFLINQQRRSSHA